MRRRWPPAGWVPTGRRSSTRAATAFTDAFNVAAIVSAVLVAVAAALVAVTYTRAKEARATAAPAEVELVAAATAE